MDVITCEVLEGHRSFVEKYVFNNKRVRATMTVSGPFRSVQRSGRRGVGQLLNGGGDPAPGVRAGVIAARRELVDARDALLERLVAVALKHQGGGARRSRRENRTLAVE